MRKHRYSKLWLYFSTIIFTIMCITGVIMISLAAYMMHTERIGGHNQNILMPIAFLSLLSIIIGTIFSGLVARRILNPITEFSDVSAEIAKGNFNIHLEETSKIKEIRELSQNFNIMAKELSSIETLRNDFVVNVSHEFKTPIAAIEGYATLLQENNLSKEEKSEYTQVILEATKQLSTLTGNILHLSKLENQEIILEKNLYRLDEQIRQVILLLEPEWSSKELNLQLNLPTTMYHGNENLLKQVWLNIIHNAIKFSNPHQIISIDIKNNTSNVIITITDTGCGMTYDTLQHVFDKFYQGDSSRKSQGNGLGLALCKRIIDLCNGDIQISSQVNYGSTFIITLPLS